MPKRIKNAKIALIDFNLTKQKLNMGVTVNIIDPSKLEGVLQRYGGPLQPQLEVSACYAVLMRLAHACLCT
jgi:hypothetical protein